MHPLKKRASNRCSNRKSQRVLATFVVVALAASVALFAPPAFAQAGEQYGSVDMQKVAAAYNKSSASEDQMKALHDQLLQVYGTQEANPMLTTQQQQQLGNLLLKPNPTDADRAQIQALEAQSQKDSQALAALQQKKDYTDDDRAQLAALTTEQQAGAQALQAVQDDYQQRMQQENDKLVQQISDDIRASVAAVAKQKGLTLVFSSDAVVYSANDITQAVINRLNGAK